MSDRFTVQLEFAIGEQVLTPLDALGTVLQRCERGEGLHDYQVCWWAESKRNVERLLPHEMRKAKQGDDFSWVRVVPDYGTGAASAARKP